jgi:hypothetical protein
MERVFKPLGMNFIQSGGTVVASGSEKMVDGSDIQPGSALAVQLIRGDLGVGASVTGTVTYRDGNKIYAFGHPGCPSDPFSYRFPRQQSSRSCPT